MPGNEKLAYKHVYLGTRLPVHNRGRMKGSGSIGSPVVNLLGEAAAVATGPLSPEFHTRLPSGRL